MTAEVTRIHPHECRYVLIVGGRSICVSSCHYGQVVSRVRKDGAA